MDASSTEDNFEEESSRTRSNHSGRTVRMGRTVTDDGESISSGRTSAFPFSTSGASTSYPVLSWLCGVVTRGGRQSLRTRLLVSFGVVAALSLCFVVGLSILITARAGDTVVNVGAANLDAWADVNIALVARLMADIGTQKMHNLEGTLLLLSTITQECVTNDNATSVPFINHYNNSQRIYPLQPKNLLPFDSQLQINVEAITDPTEAREHVRQRQPWYFDYENRSKYSRRARGISTVDASFFASNNTRQNNATQELRQIVSAYASPILKALYEHHDEVKSLSIHFVNDGFGASVTFPGRATADDSTYTSNGCDWLHQTTNPHTQRPFLSSRQTSISCQPKGTNVTYNDFNPLEQRWFEAIVLHAAPTKEPRTMLVLDASFDDDAFWCFRVGRPIFSASSGELLAVVLATVSVERFLLTDGQLVVNGIEASIGVINWDPQATFVNSSTWDPDPSNPTADTLATEFASDHGIDQDLWKQMRADINSSYETNGHFTDRLYRKNDYLTAVYPFPNRESMLIEQQEGLVPSFVVYYSIAASERETRVNTVDENVRKEVNRRIIVIVVAGAVCIAVLLGLIYMVSLFLTSPLEWMNSVGRQILSSAGSHKTPGTDSQDGHETAVQSPSSCFRCLGFGRRRVHGRSRRNRRFLSCCGKLSMNKETEQTTELDQSIDITNESGPLGTSSPTERFEFESTKPWSYRYSPRTQITLLVEEFLTMVKQFSGHGTAKVIKQQLLELKNPFMLYTNFQCLYDGRVPYVSEKHSQPCESEIATPPMTEQAMPGEVTRISLSEDRVHWGPNTRTSNDEETQRTNLHMTMADSNESKLLWRHSIFWWIAGSVALPLILCMVAISLYVLVDAFESLPVLTEDLEIAYTTLERTNLRTILRLRVNHISEVLKPHVRDVYVMNRLAGWLFMGTIPMAPTVTEMSTTAETCKDFPFGEPCLQIQDTPATACDCGWNDPAGRITCRDDYEDSRQLQRLFFEGLREDADPATGARPSTSYPDVGLFPNQTSFWDSLDALPGSANRYNASGYANTYDRVRTSSALSMIQLPLYNYVKGSLLNRSLGTFVTYDADGMMSAYAGCARYHVHSAHIQTGDDLFWWGEVPHLCPEGKYGLDSRCFSHVIDAKRRAAEGEGEPDLHLTVPRVSRDSNSQLLSSAVLPLVDSNNGDEYVATTFVRFPVQRIWETIEGTEGGEGYFRLIAQAGPQVDGSSDVIYLFDNPFEVGEEVPTPRSGMSLAEAVLPRDTCEDVFEYSKSCEYLARFGVLVKQMHEGKFSFWQIQRTGPDGEEELVNYNFDGVRLVSLSPVNASDFDRGVIETDAFVFSVVFGQTEQGVIDTFTNVSLALTQDLRIGLFVLISVIIVAFCIVVYVSWGVALSISEPIAQLWNLVTSINRSQFTAEFPELGEASYEVKRVRATFERLHLLLKAANSFFFTGQLGKAYSTLHDALSLFTKVENSKAVGITNNNLGNVTLTLYRTMKRTQAPTLCGMSSRRIIEKGCQYFRHSIDAGEEALKHINDEEGFSENYLIFMQQLSNRYFNRAMFLLTVRDDHPNPSEAQSQGLMDLSTCKAMDQEVVDNGDREGFKGDKDVYFELLLGRIKGLLLLMKAGYEDEWGIEELFDGARAALEVALQCPNHTLFRDLEPAGQMQRLDSALIEYYLLEASRESANRNEYTRKAAVVASRMMFEDDYVIGDASLLALKALLHQTHLATVEELGGDDPSDVRSSLFQYRQRITEAISLSYEGKDLISHESFAAANIGDFSMEAF